MLFVELRRKNILFQHLVCSSVKCAPVSYTHLGLEVANLTLEPIAAINVAIPESYRLLNIALVDIGAGTSDISITKDGSIIAYGMIPLAGDELTELIVQNYLVDFKTAEYIKLQSTTEEEITYKDIMPVSYTHLVQTRA